jgi:hypothetical protein
MRRRNGNGNGNRGNVMLSEKPEATHNHLGQHAACPLCREARKLQDHYIGDAYRLVFQLDPMSRVAGTLQVNASNRD